MDWETQDVVVQMSTQNIPVEMTSLAVRGKYVHVIAGQLNRPDNMHGACCALTLS